jgi:hypothetical protein
MRVLITRKYKNCPFNLQMGKDNDFLHQKCRKLRQNAELSELEKSTIRAATPFYFSALSAVFACRPGV